MNNNKLINQMLHFDSINSSYIYDINNTSTNTSNCYKCIFPMTQSYRKIKKVWLKSFELTVGFPNIRKGSTNVFKFILNSTTYTVTLTEANYTTMSSFLSVLSSACTTATGVTMTFSLNGSNTNKLIITFSSATTFVVIDTNLSKYILGFRTTDTLSSNIFTGSCNFNLTPDNYISIYIPSFNSYNANQVGYWSSFKLPLNAITNQVYYYLEQAAFEQFVNINDDNLVLSSLTVHIYDRFGNNINPNGSDYSFTLQIQYEL